jgi:SOS-response transcriptional repressor LexA
MIVCMAQIDPRARLIESALVRHGLSYRWLADRLEVTHNTISSWLAGNSKPRNQHVWRQMLELISEYERGLRTGPEVNVKRVGVREIPIYGGISAGMLNNTVSDVEMMPVMDWASDRERWGRKIDGHSMSPLLEPGDIVIFEDRPFEPGHVVHAFDNGEDTVKVVKGFGESIKLCPVNPDYPIIDAKRMSVKGVAVEKIRNGPYDEKIRHEYPHGMRASVPNF